MIKEISAHDLQDVAVKLVFGAGESIDLVANVGFGFSYEISQLRTEDILFMADRRLRLRCILGRKYHEALKDHYETSFTSADFWTTKITKDHPGMNYLIVDNSTALIASPQNGVSPSKNLLVDNENKIEELSDSFERLWSQVDIVDVVETIYLDMHIIDEEEDIKEIIVETSSIWDNVIKHLANRPQLLYQLSPRKFEELIAELLDRQGMRVKLTKQTNDGGFDILAFDDTILGEHLFLVECKKYAEARPVGVGIVRNLYGVVEHKKANAGIIVTTSSFTKGAVQFRNDVRHRITLKDYNDLTEWLRR